MVKLYPRKNPVYIIDLICPKKINKKKDKNISIFIDPQVPDKRINLYIEIEELAAPYLKD